MTPEPVKFLPLPDGYHRGWVSYCKHCDKFNAVLGILQIKMTKESLLDPVPCACGKMSDLTYVRFKMEKIPTVVKK